MCVHRALAAAFGNTWICVRDCSAAARKITFHDRGHDSDAASEIIS